LQVLYFNQDFYRKDMKKKLIKILFLSLFFSAVIPTVMNAAEQENDREKERKEAIEKVKIRGYGYRDYRLDPDDAYPSAPLLLQNILELCPKTVIAAAKQQDNSSAKKQLAHYELSYPQDFKTLQKFTNLLRKAGRDDLGNETNKIALTVAELYYLQTVFYHKLYLNIFQVLINNANKHGKMDGDMLYNHFKGVISSFVIKRQKETAAAMLEAREGIPLEISKIISEYEIGLEK